MRGTEYGAEDETNYLTGAFMAGAILSARRGWVGSISAGAWVSPFPISPQPATPVPLTRLPSLHCCVCT